MGGHGPYVWICYAVFTLFMVGLGLWSRRQQKAVLRSHKQRLSREQNGAANQGAAPASFTRIHPS
ncbi:heme exporter protein CcmD [Marinobacter zhejiangensis]|nr:heme exporter protein CcmD [Marinobacter zhejiangensis]